MGPSSRQVMPVSGNLSADNVLEGWDVVTGMRCLGHNLTNNGSIQPDWEDVSAKMWRAFWANLCPGMWRSKLASRTRLLDVCVRSVGSFRWTRWPFQRDTAHKLDHLQHHMLAILSKIPPTTGETVENYFERRRASARQLAQQQGNWSTHWARSVLSWHGHLQRAHDTGTWAPHLIRYRDLQWLEEKRKTHKGSGTGTRAYAGKPCARWLEGIVAANQVQ